MFQVVTPVRNMDKFGPIVEAQTENYFSSTQNPKQARSYTISGTHLYHDYYKVVMAAIESKNLHRYFIFTSFIYSLLLEQKQNPGLITTYEQLLLDYVEDSKSLAELYLSAAAHTLDEDLTPKRYVMQLKGVGAIVKLEDSVMQSWHADQLYCLSASVLTTIYKTDNGTRIFKSHPKVQQLKRMIHVYYMDSVTMQLVEHAGKQDIIEGVAAIKEILQELLDVKVPSDNVLDYTVQFISFLELQPGWSTVMSGLQIHYGAGAEMGDATLAKFNLKRDATLFAEWDLCSIPCCPCFTSPSAQINPTLAAQLLYGI